MKRIALFLLAAAGSLTANAQSLTLSGTSYTQNFNNLASGLPNGWHVFTFASATSLGIIQDTSSKLILTPDSSLTKWTATGGGFKNYASASSNPNSSFAPYGTNGVAQAAATDRALGVRQVSNTSTTFPGTDSGASFSLLISNTAGLTAFNMTFKLQSLDSTSPRATAWRVDYATGAAPTSFTTASTGTNSTGGNTFSNNTVTVSFGSGLNNIAGPVWIRIVTLNNTTGSGNRGTAAIDDVNLSWTGTAAGSPKPNVVLMTPQNNATGIAPSTNITMVFDKQVNKGAGNIYIKNRKTQTTNTIAVSSSNVTITAGYLVTVSGLGLQSNTTYHVMFDSTAFDTAGFKSYGIYDSTSWKFTTNSTGIANINTASLPVTVINPASNGVFNISCTMPQAAVLTVRIYDMSGRETVSKSFDAAKGDNRLSLQTALPAGAYIIRVDNGSAWGSVKATMQ